MTGTSRRSFGKGSLLHTYNACKDGAGCFFLTDEGDFISPWCGVCDVRGHGDHDQEESDEESDPIVALVWFNVEGGEGAEGEQRQRDVVHKHVGKANAAEKNYKIRFDHNLYASKILAYLSVRCIAALFSEC